MEIFNGKIQNVRRRYDSIRNFVGRNEVHMPGDILCVSTKNDDNYNLFIKADGKSTFIQLLKKSLNPTDVGPDTVGSDQIINDSVKLEDLDPEIRAILEEVEPYEVMTPEEARDRVQDIISRIEEEHGVQDAGSDANGEEADPDDI